MAASEKELAVLGKAAYYAPAAARVGDVEFCSFEAAVMTDDGDATVELLKDVTLSVKLTLDKNITIEGNNNTIYGASDSNDIYFEITGANVVVQNVTVKNFGDTAPTNGGIAVFKVPDYRSDTGFKAINVTVDEFCRSAYDIRSGSFEIEGGSINCVNNIAGESNSKLTKGILAGLGTNKVTGTVKGVSITNSVSDYEDWNTAAIEVYNNADVDIIDCEISNVKNGIHVDNYYGSGDVTVDISGTNVAVSTDAVKIYTKDSAGGKASVNIQDGNYDGAVRIYNYTQDENTVSTESDVILGGSFTSDPSKYLFSDKIAVKGNDGYAFTVIAKSETAAEVVHSVPSVTEPTLPEDATEAEQELAESVVGVLKGDNAPAISSDAVSSAANMVANENEMTSESQEVIDALADAGVDTEGETVTIVFISFPPLTTL